MESFVIGRWTVEVGVNACRVSKDGHPVGGVENRVLFKKYATCFNRNKPAYTIASVALEEIICQLDKK